MKKLVFILAILLNLAANAQTAQDVGNAAKAGAVSEAMKDSVAEPGREEIPQEKPLKRNSMIVLTSAVVVIICAAAIARRRRNKR